MSYYSIISSIKIADILQISMSRANITPIVFRNTIKTLNTMHVRAFVWIVSHCFQLRHCNRQTHMEISGYVIRTAPVNVFFSFALSYLAKCVWWVLAKIGSIKIIRKRYCWSKWSFPVHSGSGSTSDIMLSFEMSKHTLCALMLVVISTTK